eukprot:2968721-Pyramimonas_sp.AAC.1
MGVHGQEHKREGSGRDPREERANMGAAACERCCRGSCGGHAQCHEYSGSGRREPFTFVYIYIYTPDVAMLAFMQIYSLARRLIHTQTHSRSHSPALGLS